MSALEAEYLTVSEAAALLRVAPSTIRRWIRAGQISAYRLGPRRIFLRRADLFELVAPVSPGAGGIGTVMAANSANGAGRKLTAEEVRRGLEALARARRLREKITARRGGELFPSSWETLNEMRDERSRQLSGE